MNLKRPHLFFVIFILIPFFKPIGPSYYAWFNMLFQIWKVISIAIIFLCIFPGAFRQIKLKINGFWGLYLFWIIYILNCVRYGNSYSNILNNAITSIVLLGIIRYSVRQNWNYKLLKALSYIFAVYIIFQVISVIVVRSGYNIFEPMEGDFNYFLGTDNYSAFAIYPMLGIVLLYQCLSNKALKIRVSGWFLTLAVVVSYLYVRSMTAALAGVTLLAFMFLQNYRKDISKYINAKGTLVIILIAFILIHFGNIQLLFTNFIEDILHKDVTLTARSYIWDAAINLIKKRVILGHGALSEASIKDHALYGTTHAHNLYLELLLRTGVIGTIGYLWFMVGFVKSNRRNLIKWPFNILVIFFAVQIILFMMDFYVTFQYFYCFMGILYFGYSFSTKREE